MNVTTILIIVNVFAALAIIVLALMQQTKGDMGSAFGGGGSSGMFGARGSANFLSRCTSLMCAVFFISSLSLAYIYAQRASSNSVVESSVIEQAVDSEVPTIEVETNEATDVPAVDSGAEVPSEIPSIEIPEISTDVPEISTEIPEISVESAVDAIDQAVEQVEEDIKEN